MELNYVERTQIQYINEGSFINLHTGEYKTYFFNLFKKPVFTKWEIVSKGSRYGSTMEIGLKKINDTETKTIKISPYREFSYYVRESYNYE